MSQAKKLKFISRHSPNDGQITLAHKMGYDGIEKININFSQDPAKDLEDAGIMEKTIGIVAPSHITNILLNKGYVLIEFVNAPVKREKMMFCCKGAYKFYLRHPRQGVDCHTCSATIVQEYISCPISIEKQMESSLVPEKVREA